MKTVYILVVIGSLLLLVACVGPVSPIATATPASEATPAPTPLPPLNGSGGEVIAFTSERDGNSEIYIMNADGSDPRRLTDDPAYDAWPAWSPDGSQIAFMSTRSGNPDIYVMNADGSNLRQLTHHSANDIWPEWSPDSTQIAFPSRRDGNFEIYVINADGTNLQRLTNTPSHEDFPAWSPDSSRIVFSRVEGSDGTYVMNADGSDEERLADFKGYEFAWSPDSTRIAFASDHEGIRGIYIMDADGSNLQRLSQISAGENCPDWSPDGTRIAFASWRGGDGEIYVMDADGNNLQQLTDNNFEEEFPAWRPMTPVVPAVESPTPMLYPDLAAGADVRSYGGEYNDRAFDVLLLADGGTLIAGQANNTGRSHRITPGNALLIRTDSEGNLIWEMDYGGEVDAMFSSIIQAGEDDYVVLGQIAASYVRQETDMYLVKIDGEGNEIWSHTYGGRGMDHAKMVRQTSDGGYILIGGRADEFPTGNLYQGDIILIKTDAEGNEVWSRTYGDEILYLGWGVAQTPDCGYILTGWEAKTIDDRDVIAIKTNEMGEVEWSRTWDLGPGERDGGFDLILTSDGYIVIACIQSMGSGAPSAVLLKVDLDGNEIWNKLIGEEGVGNTFWHIMEDADGGYVMVGDTHVGKVPSTGEDIHAGLMIKTNADGEILWQHVFNKDGYEQVTLNSAVILPDSGYVFVGRVTRDGEMYSDVLWLKADRAKPYLGQQPPGDVPQLFAPGIVSLDGHVLRESDISFWPDGLRCIFARFGARIPEHTIFESRSIDGHWSDPAPSDLFPDGAFVPGLSPDGRRIFFVPPGHAAHGSHILHMMELNPEGWSDSVPLFTGLYASETLDRTLYYTTYYQGGDHIAYRVWEDGEYGPQQLVGSNVFSSRYEDAHPCIAPDGSYLIFDSGTRPRSNECRLYVAFRNEDGTWTEPVHLGTLLGDRRAALARITPDGKYLFFKADGDIYWVDASVVETLR